jgi:gamma-glutamyltranspeptidase / glutathione hydrolase
MMQKVCRGLIAASLLVLGLTTTSPARVAAAAPPIPRSVATGTGGAIATVDPYASRIGMRVLRRGGNAIDAAVAAAAALGVVEPYSAGIGGGGFFVAYLADRRRVVTVDGRETAPEAFFPRVFIDPETDEPYPFAERVTSGLGVGVPGTPMTWKVALERWGTWSPADTLRPARRLARKGFVVDETLQTQTEDNAARFAQFTSTRRLFLPGGEPIQAGSVLKNKALSHTYGQMMKRGFKAFYQGGIARDIVEAVKNPPLAPDATFNVRPGLMERHDLDEYHAPVRRPTKIDYRGYEVYGMAPPSSGGSTIGEALNILEGFAMGSIPREEALHFYLEASRLAFADRGAYIGDPEYFDVPLAGLLSDGFAAERRAEIGAEAMPHPASPGDPYPYENDPSPSGPRPRQGADAEGPSTTHLTVSDKWGNVVSYTLTIEQTGGSGIVVPERGFLLNNELTDFDPVPPHPNAPESGKRPRSSMSPTIITRAGVPVVALGSPGGSTIITTVLQVTVNFLDFGMSLPEAIAAPRATQRNTPTTLAEPAFLASPERALLEARGHAFAEIAEIGAATGIAFLGGGSVQAAAEPERRGGGDARVENP